MYNILFSIAVISNRNRLLIICKDYEVLKTNIKQNVFTTFFFINLLITRLNF